MAPKRVVLGKPSKHGPEGGQHRPLSHTASCSSQTYALITVLCAKHNKFFPWAKQCIPSCIITQIRNRPNSPDKCSIAPTLEKPAVVLQTSLLQAYGPRCACVTQRYVALPNEVPAPTCFLVPVVSSRRWNTLRTDTLGSHFSRRKDV